MLTMVDLCSGIGGFTYAAHLVGGFETIAFCENDPFCQRVLMRHWPQTPICADIHKFTKEWLNEKTGQETADVFTAGVPCQPASIAGKRRGTKDDRWLWDEALRVVAELKPQWCLFENPVGILSLQGGVPFDEVLASLESEGYETGTFVLPACAVNAPHRRDRVWIVADANRSGCNGKEIPIQSRGSRQKSTVLARGDCVALESWDENWVEIASELCRVDDELPVRLDGFKLSKSAHRRERLKALGNAVVPQVVAEILRFIRVKCEEVATADDNHTKRIRND